MLCKNHVGFFAKPTWFFFAPAVNWVSDKSAPLPMKSLSKDWITEGLLDVEYKSYILLAYLNDVRKEFAEKKIYPGLADLLAHYQNLMHVKSGRENLQQSFPRQLQSADWENLRLEYKNRDPENDFFKVMDEILEYSIPAMKKGLDEGGELYEHVEKNLHISEIGLRSPSPDAGYFFLCAPPKLDARVYQYNLTRVILPDGPYRALHVSHISDYRLSFTTTFESIRSELIRHHQPTGYSTWLIESEVFVPWEESLLPVAKRRLVQHLHTVIDRET